MMASNSIKTNPVSLLETNIYRWNHDKKHPNKTSQKKSIHGSDAVMRTWKCRYDEIEVKCIFKPKYFNDVMMHHPLEPINSKIKIIETINNTKSPLDPWYYNLREKDIKEGYLLCYHYRVVSVEQCINKLKSNSWYNRKWTLDDLLQHDYAEIIDETLKDKSIIAKKI